MPPWQAKHFTLKEAIWLPSWGRVASSSELTSEAGVELVKLFGCMDTIRDMVDCPVSVHSALRPSEYNKLVGGARNSAHLYGMACDFSVQGRSCDSVRAFLLPYLGLLDLRMENLPGSGWVHVDTRQPSDSGRFFTP